MADCHDLHCVKPARMALRVTRPTRENVMLTMWSDERSAPRTTRNVTLYCKEHGIETVNTLLGVLVDEG